MKLDKEKYKFVQNNFEWSYINESQEDKNPKVNIN
jgi:hypothetical protein